MIIQVNPGVQLEVATAGPEGSGEGVSSGYTQPRLEFACIDGLGASAELTMINEDRATVEGFGDEWTRFDNAALSATEHFAVFTQYFASFPWETLPGDSVGFDAGCGSGRWALLVAERVGTLHCVDASPQALDVARRLLSAKSNCVFHQASVSDLPFAAGSMDFGYSLGVLHHTPDPEHGLRSCVAALKPGAPFLLYLYYRFDNKPFWYGWLWQLSNLQRLVICRLPRPLRFLVCDLIAAVIYWPLARTARILEQLGVAVETFPLAYYRHRSFYVMRNDALDRFGTRLERRFTQAEMRGLMERCGLERIAFNDHAPFWCAVGRKRTATRAQGSGPGQPEPRE